MKDLFPDIDPPLIRKFALYHRDHPIIYVHFMRYAIQMRRQRAKYSAWSIINRIRWDHDLHHAEPFKINNDFIALYARLLMHDEPSFANFFELRKMKPRDRRDSREERYRQGEAFDNYKEIS